MSVPFEALLVGSTIHRTKRMRNVQIRMSIYVVHLVTGAQEDLPVLQIRQFLFEHRYPLRILSQFQSCQVLANRTVSQWIKRVRKRNG
jgi:hypothetical protein